MDSDVEFARLIADLDQPSVFASSFSNCRQPHQSSVCTTDDFEMAVAAAASRAGPLPAAQHHDVAATDAEYTSVRQELHDAGLTLTRLVKLNNLVLEEKFRLEATHFMKVKAKGFALNTRSLYHGTTAPFDQICEEGLDERLSRRGRFGRGIYFSDNPQKCCKYSEYKSTQPYVLKCKVILGDVKEYAQGEQDPNLAREPQKTVKDGKRVYYDSVQGQPVDHTEYVIYDKRRALIEYIAFYQPPPSANKPTKTKSKTSSSGAAANNIPSATSTSPRADSDDSESDAGAGERMSRDGSPRSGRGSPGSGRVSPLHSDASFGDDDVNASLPGYTDTCSVPRVNVARNRTRGSASLAADTVTEGNLPGGSSSSTAAASASTTASASASATAAHPQYLISPDVITCPQLAALKQLLSLKGKIPQDQFENLTREYHRTYGAQGSLGGLGPAAAATVRQPVRGPQQPVAQQPADDPVSEVMTQLIKDFQDVTQCTDRAMCRRYLELTKMDLNQAIEAYIDANS